jgi:alkaline phosphatase
MLFFMLALVHGQPAYPLLPSDLDVKNIIFLIGDGMGIAQVMAARIKNCGAAGRLNMELMPVTGLVNTCSADDLITDSGAGGTALATGFKANNWVIGIDPEGRVCRTILEACQIKKMSTGLVVTSSITHATPASFSAHADNRGDEPDIALQLLEKKIDVLLGGGREFFLPGSRDGSKREDERDLLEYAKKIGYEIVQDKIAMQRSKSLYLLGLFQMAALACDSTEPSLAEMTAKAIEMLDRDEDGFFLMVEGSQIDWECHDNALSGTVKHVVLLDEAVRIALDFALQDSHTIVIVTADHETGGLGFIDGSLDGKTLTDGWLSKNHTPAMVPVFAFGPRAELFTGVHENTEIPRILARIAAIDSFPFRK